MIHGATSAGRARSGAATSRRRSPSARHGGIARSLDVTRGSRTRAPPARAPSVVDPHVGGGLGDPEEHRVVDCVAAGGHLEARAYRVGHLRQRVLTLDVRTRGRAEVAPCAAATVSAASIVATS